jgi:hypothetical protein
MISVIVIGNKKSLLFSVGWLADVNAIIITLRRVEALGLASLGPSYDPLVFLGGDPPDPPGLASLGPSYASVFLDGPSSANWSQ